MSVESIRERLKGKESVKFLLVYPDFTEIDTVGKNSGGNYSEGLASISAVLKAAGHEVRLLHLKYSHNEEEYKKKFSEMNYVPDLVGFSMRTTAFDYVAKCVLWTKQLVDCFIFCGSYHPTLVPDEVIALEGVDAVCIGEGEYPARELAKRFIEGGDIYSVQSHYFKKDTGEIVKNPVMPLIENLDELPIPDFDLFDYADLDSMRIDTALVMMSRGCLFSCTYCGNSQFRNVYPNKQKYARFRSADNSMEYLHTLLNKYPNIRFFNFRDAIFNMYPDWFDVFIERYKNEIHLPFTCNLRLDVLTEDTVCRMKEAGCYLIDVGVESGNPEIRKKYLRRMMTDEQMINATSWFHKYGITTLTYNIFGLPHEDLKSALMTVKLNVKLKSDKIIPNIFYPYPMTVLHDIAKEAGFVPDVIPSDCRVPLKQKQFPEHEVLFAASYFLSYVKAYRRLQRLPKWLGGRLEKFLDWTFTSKLTPHKFLVFVYDAKSFVRARLKQLLLNRFPKLYLKLRNNRIEKLSKSKEK